MAKSVNKVFLLGHFGKDPELGITDQDAPFNSGLEIPETARRFGFVDNLPADTVGFCRHKSACREVTSGWATTRPESLLYTR